MNDLPTNVPSRRRGRPPKNSQPPTISILAPPQESAFHTQVESVQPVPSSQAPTVPSPLAGDCDTLSGPFDDNVDLRETPAMAARHSQPSQLSGSDSKEIRGASDSYLPVEAGTPGLANPVLPEQSQALPVQERIPEPSRTEAMHPPAAPVQIIPPIPPISPGPDWIPIQENDVVQINSSHNKLYGTLFTVAGIRNHRIHGYQLLAGGKHEYITVNENECFRIGPSKLRSRNGCSAKWIADIR